MRPTLLLLLTLAGCYPARPTYVEARGALGDGTRFDVRFDGNVDTSAATWKVRAEGEGPGELRGFWIWFDTGVVRMGQSYPSTGSDRNVGPVHVFLVRPLAGGTRNDVMASLIDGGTVTFTAGGPDNYAGTLENLVLVRGGQTEATIDAGEFLAMRPR